MRTIANLSVTGTKPLSENVISIRSYSLPLITHCCPHLDDPVDLQEFCDTSVPVLLAVLATPPPSRDDITRGKRC
jgi:hypothetical protein